MSAVIALFGVTVFAAAVLALLAKHRHAMALVLFAVVVGASYTGFEALLSRAKPVGLELFAGREDVLVIAHTFDDGKAIYVLVQRETPRLYSLPWSEETAQQLQDAMEAAEGQGTAVLMRFGYDRDTEEPMFYAVPQQQDRPMKP